MFGYPLTCSTAKNYFTIIILQLYTTSIILVVFWSIQLLVKYKYLIMGEAIAVYRHCFRFARHLRNI